MCYWVTLKTAGVGVLGAFDRICSVAKSCPALCDPRDCMQSSRLPCPSPSGVCSNACPLRGWCHSTISSSVGPSPAFSLSQHQGLFQGHIEVELSGKSRWPSRGLPLRSCCYSSIPVSSLSLVFLLLISDPFAVFFVFLDTLDEIFIQAQSPNNGGFVRLTLERLLFSQALPLNPGEEALRLSGSLSPWSQPRLPHGGSLLPCWRPWPAPRLVLFFSNAKRNFAVL